MPTELSQSRSCLNIQRFSKTVSKDEKPQKRSKYTWLPSPAITKALESPLQLISLIFPGIVFSHTLLATWVLLWISQTLTFPLISNVKLFTIYYYLLEYTSWGNIVSAWSPCCSSSITIMINIYITLCQILFNIFFLWKIANIKSFTSVFLMITLVPEQ